MAERNWELGKKYRFIAPDGSEHFVTLERAPDMYAPSRAELTCIVSVENSTDGVATLFQVPPESLQPLADS